MSLLRHIVLFPIKADVSDDRLAEALRVLRALEYVDGVVEWRVELSRDTRKGRVLVENGVIDSEQFDAFRASPAHQHAGEVMSAIADVWLIGDYPE